MACGECKDCGFLDKSYKEMSPNGTGHYIYGCNYQGRKRCVGWIKSDNELSLMGCSFFKEKILNEQIQIEI